MIEILKEIELNLKQLLISSELYTMYIDYHKPYVARILFKYKDYRVFLHKIYPCNEAKEALFHPHPWESAIKILSGNYEMSIGHSETNETPTKIDSRLILGPGTYYEMLDPDGWHYVKPNNDMPSYSLMVIGKQNYRAFQEKEQHFFRRLTEEEIKGQIWAFKDLMRFEFETGQELTVDGKKILVGLRF